MQNNRGSAVPVKVDDVYVRRDYESGDVVEDRAGVPGLRVTCTRCGHSILANGDTDRALKWCFHRMRESCQRGQSNFYTEAK